MASNMSAYLANKILDHVFKATTYTAPTNTYIGLSVNGSAEISGNGYARTVQASSAAASSANTTSAAVTFPTPTASWGAVAYAAEFDAASAGNQLTSWKALTGGAVTVNAWDTFRFAAGDIDRTA